MKNTIVDEVKAASESYDLIAKSQTLSDILNGEGGAIVLASAAKELYLAAQGEQPSYTDYLSKTTTSQQTVAGSV